jgi:hypothetical protein
VYIFDTFLPTITGFSVSAHPDSSAFKRTFTYTFANNAYDGGTHTCYFWVNWEQTAAPTNCRIYHDLDYTATPQDTSTSTSITGYQGAPVVNANFVGTYRFWKTTTNPRAFLITHGLTPWMYWPGYTNLRTWGSPTVWNGTYQTREQSHPGCIWGTTDSNNYYGSPNTYGSTSKGLLVPISVPSYAVEPDENYLVRDPLMVFNNAGNTVSDIATPGMWDSTVDFGILRNPVTVANNGYRIYMGWGGTNLNNGVMYLINGTDYWLRTNVSNTYMGHPAFYFGTSEPDLSI